MVKHEHIEQLRRFAELQRAAIRCAPFWNPNAKYTEGNIHTIYTEGANLNLIPAARELPIAELLAELVSTNGKDQLVKSVLQDWLPDNYSPETTTLFGVPVKSLSRETLELTVAALGNQHQRGVDHRNCR